MESSSVLDVEDVDWSILSETVILPSSSSLCVTGGGGAVGIAGGVSGTGGGVAGGGGGVAGGGAAGAWICSCFGFGGSSAGGGGGASAFFTGSGAACGAFFCSCGVSSTSLHILTWTNLLNFSFHSKSELVFNKFILTINGKNEL